MAQKLCHPFIDLFVPVFPLIRRSDSDHTQTERDGSCFGLWFGLFRILGRFRAGYRQSRDIVGRGRFANSTDVIVDKRHGAEWLL